MSITVMSFTLIIHVQPGILMSGIAMALAICTFFGQLVMTHFAANSAQYSKQAVMEQERRISLTDKYLLSSTYFKALKGCKEFALKSGSFRVLDREAVKIVMMANIDYTISCLLTVSQ